MKLLERWVEGHSIMNHNGNFAHTVFTNNCHESVQTTVCEDRWAIILAGGDGTRLRSLTRTISGDDRPKQFCALLGNETLLAQTINRVSRALPLNKILFAVTETHEPFYNSILEGVAEEQLVVQPKNAGTAPAILYSLLRLSQDASDSTVAVFPSDHHLSDDASFMNYVESAFEYVRLRKDLIILLGIHPERPETDYGWIEPVSPGLAGNPEGLSWVRRFWEKPTPEVARDLMNRGCLWNSFVMVGKVSSFLKALQQTVPGLFNRFSAIEPYLNTRYEKQLVTELFSDLSDVHFSKQVLAARPGNLAVLPVTGLIWNDLGRPERVLSTHAELFAQKPNGPVLDSLRMNENALGSM